MEADKNRPKRDFITTRFYDRMTNPPTFVDQELPTRTVKIFSRKKQGTVLDSSSGVTIMGSIYFSGSNYDTSPGTYSLRITRRSVSIGSRVSSYNNEAEWALRHSRIGTIDKIPFWMGTRSAQRETSFRPSAEAFGGPLNPLYSFGPGTLWNYINPRRGTMRVYTSLEGITG